MSTFSRVDQYLEYFQALKQYAAMKTEQTTGIGSNMDNSPLSTQVFFCVP